MYTLIEAIKETKTSVFFKAEHKELETLHTIEVQKEKIQDYLEYCGQAWISDSKIDNIMHDEITIDICQDIVRFGGEYSVTDQELIGWNVKNVYGKSDFVSVKEYGKAFIQTLQNSMAVLSTQAVYK
jgi:hypothetical protein